MGEGHLEVGLEKFDTVRELVANYCDVLRLRPEERLKIHVWFSASVDKASVHHQLVQFLLRPRVSAVEELKELERRGVELMQTAGILPHHNDRGEQVPLASLPDRILHRVQLEAVEAQSRKGVPYSSYTVRRGNPVADQATIEFATRLLGRACHQIQDDLSINCPETRVAREERVWCMLADLKFNSNISVLEKSASPSFLERCTATCCSVNHGSYRCPSCRGLGPSSTGGGPSARGDT